jgi:D-hexose-6-phosphate mutarotase
LHTLRWGERSALLTLFFNTRSKMALYQKDKAVRGGIPICWPQFGPGALVQHGFARTSLFSVKSVNVDAERDRVSITLALNHNEATLKLWNHKFELSLTTELDGDGSFVQTLTAQNLDESSSEDSKFQFTTALHTYFAVPDVTKTTISPLGGVHYMDKVAAAPATQEEDGLSFQGEVDRVYYNPSSISEIKTDGHRLFSVERNGFEDLVTWNIGEQKQKGIADLSSWQDYVCAEVAQIKNPVVLAAGAKWSATQTLRAHL